jgi:hypothetical protein
MNAPATLPRRAARDVDPPRTPSAEQLILKAVRAIRFGTVQITIHDSEIVQIERTEKVRIGKT